MNQKLFIIALLFLLFSTITVAQIYWEEPSPKTTIESVVLNKEKNRIEVIKKSSYMSRMWLNWEGPTVKVKVWMEIYSTRNDTIVYLGKIDATYKEKERTKQEYYKERLFDDDNLIKPVERKPIKWDTFNIDSLNWNIDTLSVDSITSATLAETLYYPQPKSFRDELDSLKKEIEKLKENN